jgi:hypothetical protein
MITNKPNEQPFFTGDIVVVDWAFSNRVGGKRATVESCEKADGCESGWMVKIDLYPNPIDSNWLIKIPNNA